MEKKKYYVNLQSKEISQIQYQNNNMFTIHATDEEVLLLRKKLVGADVAEFDTFWRAHVPIVPYHNDPSNDRYDRNLAEAYQMIYDLGDDQTKEFIEETGMLGERPIDTEN